MKLYIVMAQLVMLLSYFFPIDMDLWICLNHIQKKITMKSFIHKTIEDKWHNYISIVQSIK